MIGEVSLPSYSTGDTFSDTQRKCAEYAALRAAEDLQRNGHVTSPTGIQSYVDECGAQISRQRETRQLMVFGSILTGIGALWWFWSKR